MKTLISALLALTALVLLLAAAFRRRPTETEARNPCHGRRAGFRLPGESRPVLVRLHVRLEGKSLRPPGTSASTICSNTSTSTTTVC